MAWIKTASRNYINAEKINLININYSAGLDDYSIVAVMDCGKEREILSFPKEKRAQIFTDELILQILTNKKIVDVHDVSAKIAREED